MTFSRSPLRPRKHEQVAAVRIALQHLLHHQRQARKAFAHVRVAGRQPDLHATRDRDHRRSSRSRIRPSASVSISLSTRTRRPPPSSIVTILAFLRDRETGRGSAGVGRSDGTAAIFTGTSCGTGGAATSQSCLRHRKSVSAKATPRGGGRCEGVETWSLPARVGVNFYVCDYA